MAVWNPKPLSWGERMELAQSLRKEAAEKIAEAQRIEDGLSADQDAVYAAVEAAWARIEAKKVGDGDTATERPNKEVRGAEQASPAERPS